MRTSLLIAAGLVLALACSGTRAQDDKEPEIITRSRWPARLIRLLFEH